ncbi:hypothetical protein P3X46_028938 [Hevea brasiliensis]|uniref:Uncharacterized protein n=1 Tax=Hevea brasiliensis TaxID=3981 RepID=A0ABQ9KR68_HEVBR|nr:hypothetical protein P3X46_028938 [Hevea brasiliensis]
MQSPPRTTHSAATDYSNHHPLSAAPHLINHHVPPLLNVSLSFHHVSTSSFSLSPSTLAFLHHRHHVSSLHVSRSTARPLFGCFSF